MPIDPAKIRWDSAPPQGGLRPLNRPVPKQATPQAPSLERKTNVETSVLSQTAPFAAPKAKADLRRSQAEAAGAELDLRNKRLQGPGVTPDTIAAARGKVGNALLFRKQLQRAWELYKGTQKRPGLGSIMEYLPTPENAEFDASVEALQPLARQMFRVPGSGADSDRELQVLLQLLPKRSSFDEKNEQRFDQLFNMVDDIVNQNAPVAGMKVTRTRRGQPKGKPKSRVINFDELPE